MKPRRPVKKWCRACDKVRRCDVMRDRDAWTCRTCKTVTTGLDEVQLRHPPGEVKGDD